MQVPDYVSRILHDLETVYRYIYTQTHIPWIQNFAQIIAEFGISHKHTKSAKYADCIQYKCHMWYCKLLNKNTHQQSKRVYIKYLLNAILN